MAEKVKIYFLLIIFFAIFNACSTAVKKPDFTLNKETQSPSESVYKILEETVPETSKKYFGKGFKLGANPDKSGYSDCSNLICAITRNSLTGSNFDFIPVYLPTPHLKENSYPVKRSDLKIGDMVFYIKSKGNNKINHAGIIIQIEPAKLSFVHASTSKGVIVTSTDSDSWNYYWKERFSSFRRWNKKVFGGK